MSGQITRVRASVSCTKSQAKRVLDAISYGLEYQAGRQPNMKRSFLSLFGTNIDQARTEFERIGAAGFGIDAVYHEGDGLLSICESYEGAKVEALVQLLQKVLPKNLPISIEVTENGEAQGKTITVEAIGGAKTRQA